MTNVSCRLELKIRTHFFHSDLSNDLLLYTIIILCRISALFTYVYIVAEKYCMGILLINIQLPELQMFFVIRTDSDCGKSYRQINLVTLSL